MDTLYLMIDDISDAISFRLCCCATTFADAVIDCFAEEFTVDVLRERDPLTALGAGSSIPVPTTKPLLAAGVAVDEDEAHTGNIVAAEANDDKVEMFFISGGAGHPLDSRRSMLVRITSSQRECSRAPSACRVKVFTFA
jgi:hypothetical protein